MRVKSKHSKTLICQLLPVPTSLQAKINAVIVSSIKKKSLKIHVFIMVANFDFYWELSSTSILATFAGPHEFTGQNECRHHLQHQKNLKKSNAQTPKPHISVIDQPILTKLCRYFLNYTEYISFRVGTDSFISFGDAWFHGLWIYLSIFILI